MYVPRHFEVSDADEIFAVLDANAFGQLVSRQDGEIVASHLPFLVATDRRHLHCHLARLSRPVADRQGVAERIEQLGSRPLASAMRKALS